ncbi:MAG TPA: hypothetical protein ENK78_06140 [Thiothrix sp.]|nr:hypothetical protein [Thiothrix sp.]
MTIMNKTILLTTLSSGVMCAALFTSPAAFAAKNHQTDTMRTMQNNMAQPIVRVKRRYSGMFQGWKDTGGFTTQWPMPSVLGGTVMMSANPCTKNCKKMSKAD